MVCSVVRNAPQPLPVFCTVRGKYRYHRQHGRSGSATVMGCWTWHNKEGGDRVDENRDTVDERGTYIRYIKA